MENKILPYAEEINYWKTSQSSPDTWIERAKKVIEKAGGTIKMDAFGSSNGKAAYMLSFSLDDELYKVIWNVLPSMTGNEKAAKIQAATMLYHDIKAKCMTAMVLGSRTAFFSYLMLPDGRTAQELTNNELINNTPEFLINSNNNAISLPEKIEDGEFE